MTVGSRNRCRVIVVGAGNAALCAALAAREAGASVLVLERAPIDERGGNTAFTAGAMRFAYDSVQEIMELVPDLSENDLAVTDFGAYPQHAFYEDLARVTEYRTDPDLADCLVSQSLDTLRWMKSHGVRFMPIYGRQAFKVDGRFRFWGGLILEVSGGGKGLVDTLFAAAERDGIEIAYEARAVDLLMRDGRTAGVRVIRSGRTEEVIPCDAVVLASGGFEANTEWRTRYLGPGWDLAKVRGSRYNFGDGIRMAIDAGAQPWGQWSGAHAVGWDFNAPAFGDLVVGDGFQKHSYPFGILVNARGARFVDEGADFRNYTYAKYGREILRQPGQIAWQIFDSQVTHLLRDEYRIKTVSKVKANTIAELARGMDGVDQDRLIATIHEFNESVRTDMEFDPNTRDGRGTRGLTINKSNWANPIVSPPFEAYAVTCGITFTFGGVQIDTESQVLDTRQRVIPGLFACGEMVGGIFYFNYPGGSGLTSGSVFGRIAGRTAAEFAAGLG
ncbi:FAD-dependent tricarballylate dehydrogenase TcuA [Mycolicibacterium sp.]|uniref:FAD-dependent tricarballylate dehydrogenase TcuA n=1 Tax=Mycolicibacterium sp. TaxID=2320850 RepID=UPI003D0F66C3